MSYGLKMVRIVACDWNRTLFEEPYDSDFFFGLIRKLALLSLGALDIKSTFRLLKAKHACSVLLERCLDLEPTDSSNRAALVREMVETLNTFVIRGISEVVLERYLSEYATRTANRLDKRLLTPLAKLHDEFGIPTIVLSSGCAPGIRHALDKVNFPFELVIANDFERKNGYLEKFNVKVYGNKGALLRDILSMRNITCDEAVFIGDDWEDRECFEMVKFPIVSFHASQQSKTLLSKACNAFVPGDAVDLEGFIGARREQC